MAQYYHKKFGTGTLIQDTGSTFILRFSHTIEECPKSEIEVRLSTDEKINQNHYDYFVPCVLHTQAALIQSINDSWGVFSKSSVDLLPHQVWVCNRVIQKWPFRYLIADDVGLGKTIEAGLILWPLIASGKIKRLLILTPAPLVEQWRERLLTMFDIRLIKYTKEQDTDKSGFWDSSLLYVVASMPTLTQVSPSLREERQNRLLESDKWDLVIVDEAHHMNADERQGKTLGFELLEKLENANKVDSCLFFTGTPHRGKDYGFWALMRLVNPDVFSEKKGNTEQYEHLGDYFIRNNKQNVTDMKGNKLFKELRQHPGTFDYTPIEEEFYNKMSAFILEGKAYAITQDAKICQQIMLVLIALQKIASSSIYAVKAAFKTRLKKFETRINIQKNTLQQLENDLLPDELESLIEDEKGKDELRDILKEYLGESIGKSLVLMKNEAEHLKELVDLADKIKEESRINKIVETIEKDYPDEQVLLFTEYKRTQALMISALIKKWGKNSVGFINGDNRLPNIQLESGEILELSENRITSAEKFNEGKIRFLVSTEAAGEGIDLQKKCHVLVHIDLPWNPMRLHQRVGRLNRYGQTKPVDVLSFRNMQTVESRIWAKLEQKLIQIEKTFIAGMGDPEDIMQLVLGMQDPGFFDRLYSEGLVHCKNNTLDDWFNATTQTFGGEKVITTVENLTGRAAKFNLTGLDSVPKLDLPDLIPFFKNAIKSSGRRITSEDEIHFSFLTPKGWDNEFGIKDEYKNLIFKRNTENDEKPGDICGVGHKIFQKALEFANNLKESLCLISGDSSYYVFRVFDRITYSRGNVSSKFIVIKQTDNSIEPMTEECFFRIINNLKPSTNSTELKKTVNTEDFKEIIEANLAKSNNFNFRQVDYELFSAFLNA